MKNSEINKNLINNLIFEITYKCNSNCLYCYNVWKASNAYPKGKLSYKKTIKLLDKAISETKVTKITISGGEPLLYKKLNKFIKHLNKYKLTINLITNGTLLTEKKIKKFIKNGVSLFELPLLSHNKETHNKLMRFNSFDLITQAIVNIKKHAGNVVIVFIATSQNIDDFLEVARLAYALNVDGIMLNRFNPGGEGIKNMDLLPDVESLKRCLTIANQKALEYDMPIFSAVPIQPCIIDTAKYPNVGFGFCGIGKENAYYTIDFLGNLRLCNHSSKILGNLFLHSFSELINQEIVQNYINAFPKSCISCNHKNICSGGCKASSEVCYGDIYKEEPFLKGNYY